MTLSSRAGGRSHGILQYGGVEERLLLLPKGERVCGGGGGEGGSP